MNQILYKCIPEDIKPIQKRKFFYIFIISIILIVLLILVYIFIKYKLLENEKISKKIISNYNIMTLYSDINENNNVNKLLQDNNNQPFVIGLIQIDKINLTYPILSATNDELLKISPCRFARSNAK